MIAGKIPIDTGGNGRLISSVIISRAREACQDSSCSIISKMFQNFLPMRGSFPIGLAQAIPSFSHETAPSGMMICAASSAFANATLR